MPAQHKILGSLDSINSTLNSMSSKLDKVYLSERRQERRSQGYEKLAESLAMGIERILSLIPASTTAIGPMAPIPSTPATAPVISGPDNSLMTILDRLTSGFETLTSTVSQQGKTLDTLTTTVGNISQSLNLISEGQNQLSQLLSSIPPTGPRTGGVLRAAPAVGPRALRPCPLPDRLLRSLRQRVGPKGAGPPWGRRLSLKFLLTMREIQPLPFPQYLPLKLLLLLPLMVPPFLQLL